MKDQNYIDALAEEIHELVREIDRCLAYGETRMAENLENMLWRLTDELDALRQNDAA